MDELKVAGIPIAGAGLIKFTTSVATWFVLITLDAKGLISHTAKNIF